MFDLLIVLIVGLPLVGFVVTALIGRRLDREAHWIPVGLIVLVWAISMVVAFATLTHAEPFGEAGHGTSLFTWIPAGDFQVHAAFYVDALTACLLIVVTTIGMLVHIYSIGYMSHDPGYWRFFAYLNLFMFSMLLLVTADSFLVLFVAWELVGLSSYLLIGFWKHKRTAALAAKKAFIVNRVGDVGFALGIMLIFASLHTLDIHGADGVLARIGTLDHGTILAISLLIFAGAMGKSAQFPLHVWLPDAMEGPTPVSALIHAATMVNAGVYLVARTSPIFAGAQEALVVVAAIGIFTAILAASIAMTQTDIKRVDLPPDGPRLLQGTALPRVGLGDPRRPRGTGHAPDGRPGKEDPDHLRDDARRFTGDRRNTTACRLLLERRDPRRVVQARLPVGLGDRGDRGPDDRLLHVPADGPDVLGEEQGRSPRRAEHPRVAAGDDVAADSPGHPVGPGRADPGPAVRGRPACLMARADLQALDGNAPPRQLFGIDGALIGVSVAVAAAGIAVAWRLFGAEIGRIRLPPRPAAVSSISARVPFLYRASLNKWWFDDLYHLLFIVIGGRIAAFLWWFDRRVVDDTVNDLAKSTVGAGRGLRRVQTGRVQNYALGIALGLLVMAGSFLILAGRV